MRRLVFTVILFFELFGCATLTDEKSDDISTLNVEDCVVSIIRKIENQWEEPTEWKSLVATVAMKLDESGSISDLFVVKSNGYTEFYTSIIKDLTGASPFVEVEGICEVYYEKLRNVNIDFKPTHTGKS